MERIAIVVFKHGLQPSVASEPTGGLAAQYNTCRLEDIGDSGIDARERCWVQQCVDGNMNDNLRRKARCLKFARNKPICEFAHTQKALGPPLFASQTFMRDFIEIGGNSANNRCTIGDRSFFAFGAHMGGDGIERRKYERSVHMIERSAQLNAVVIVKHHHPTCR